MRGEDPECRECRIARQTAMSDEERERFRRWWLEESGLSEQELVWIAAGLSS